MRDQGLSHQALTAALTVARAHGLRVTDPVILSDRANLIVHLRPSPVIAKVATTITLLRAAVRPALVREVSVARFLAKRGASSVPPSPELPAGPHEQDGLHLTFWQHVPHDPDAVVEPAVVGRALGELHQALRDYPGLLPRLESPLTEVAGALDSLHRTSQVSDTDLAVLRAEHDQLLPALLTGEGQALHGDAHPGNLLSSRNGPLWIDFEETCFGPVTWDLACLANTTRMSGAAALAGYPDQPDPAPLALFRRARLLQGTVWLLLLAQRFPEERGHAMRRMAEWRDR